jgi:hypothetical protein
VKRDLVLGGLLVALLLAVTLLTSRTAEKPPLATHASADFGFGGYRAWYDVLAREGVDVRRFRRAHAALGEAGIDTLVVAFPAHGLPSTWHAADAAALRAWVARGGKLVDIGETPRTRRDDDKAAQVLLKETNGSQSALRGPWTGAVGALAERGTFRLDVKQHATARARARSSASPTRARSRTARWPAPTPRGWRTWSRNRAGPAARWRSTRRFAARPSSSRGTSR